MSKKSLVNWMFYILYTLFLTINICSNVIFVAPIKLLISIIVTVLLFFLILLQEEKYKKQEFLKLLFLLILSIISYCVSKCNYILMSFLFVIACKKIDVKKVIKFDIKLKSLLIIITIIFYKIGLAENIIMYRENGTIRNSLGFSHPNSLGAFLFAICLDIMYLKYKKNKFTDYILLGISLAIAFFICDSRASQIGIILLLSLSLLLPKFEKNKILKKIIILLPLIVFIISILSIIFYSKGNSLFISLNVLFSNRIKWAYQFLNYYSINLFGNYFQLYGVFLNSGNYIRVLDNAYINLLLRFGLVIFITVMYSTTKLLARSIKYNRYEVILVLTVILIYGLMESSIFRLPYNSLILLFSELLYSNKRKELK